MRRVALVLVGLILLIAGALKVWALSGPVDTLGWPRELIVAGSAVELLLGFWLISGAAIRAAHLAAIGIFLLFAALSTYQVIRGVPSCGCLGKLYVHPAWMLTFDLVTLGVLTVLWFVEGRRAPLPDMVREAKLDRHALSYALSAWAACSVALIALIAAGWAFAGAFDGSAGGLSKQDVLISPSTIDLGSGAVGETKQATVRIVNASASPVRIVGGRNNCSCLLTPELPITVPARGSVELPIQVSIKSEGFREVAFTLYSDQKTLRPLTGQVRIDGKAFESASAN